MKRARRIVLSLLTALILLFSFSLSFADELDMLSAEILSKFKVVSTEIMTGTDIGFEESKTLTRAEVATIIIRLSGYLNGVADGIDTSDVAYADVPADHWAKDYIALATKLGLVKGIGDGKFAPDDLVTIQEVETMVCRAIGAGEYIDTLGEWPENYKQFSHEHGIDKYIIKMGGDDSLRINTAVIIANVLDLPKGHVTHNNDGSLGWQFDDKTVAEENLGVRLVENKNCTSVKAGSFNGITVKEGVDLSIVKEGTKYDYYINSKNVIVGIWPSSLKEDAEKEQDLINKGIDPSTLKDGQKTDTDTKNKKRSGGGQTGPSVVNLSSITSNAKLTLNTDTSRSEFTPMNINGMTASYDEDKVSKAVNGEEYYEVKVKYTIKENYTLKGTNITENYILSNYPIVLNKGCAYYLELMSLEFEEVEEPTYFELGYFIHSSEIDNSADGLREKTKLDNVDLQCFLNRGCTIKKVEGKKVTFRTIADGIYFNDTEDHYINTFSLNNDVEVYARVSNDQRELEVKFGTLIDLNDSSIVTKKVAYTAYQRVDLPKLDLEKVNQTPVKDEREFTDVKQTEVFEITPKEGDTFKDRSGNKQLTPEILTISGTGVETDATQDGAKLLSVRVIVEFDDENDKYKVTVVSFGQSLGDISSSILPASMSSDDKFTLPVINNENIDTTTTYETKAVEPGETITVKYKVNNDNYSFNKATVLDKTTLTTDSTNGKVTGQGASVYAKLEESKYDPKEDAYNVTFKIYPVEISQATADTKASLGASNALTVPKLDNFTRDKDADTFTFLNVDEPYVVTYTPRDHFKVKSGAVTAQGISSNNAEPYDLLTNAGSNLNVRMSVEVSETDNKVTVTFTPERKLAGDISTKASLANNELTLPVVDNAKAYVLNEEQEYVDAEGKTFTDGGETYTVYYKPEDFYTFKDVELTATSENAGEGFVTYDCEPAGDPAANTRLSSADSCVTVGLTVTHDTTNDMYKVVFTSYKKKISSSNVNLATLTKPSDNLLKVATMSIAPISLSGNTKATVKVGDNAATDLTQTDIENGITINANKTVVTVTYEASKGYTFNGANLMVLDLIGDDDNDRTTENHTLANDACDYYVYAKFDSSKSSTDKLVVIYTAYSNGELADEMQRDEPSDGDWDWPHGGSGQGISVSFAPDEIVTFKKPSTWTVDWNKYTNYFLYKDGNVVSTETSGNNYKVCYAHEIDNTECGTAKASISDTNVFTPRSIDNATYSVTGTDVTFENSKYTIKGTSDVTVTYTVNIDTITGGKKYWTFSNRTTSENFTAAQFKSDRTDGYIVGEWPCDYYLEVKSCNIKNGTGIVFSNQSYAGYQLEVVYTVHPVVTIREGVDGMTINLPTLTNADVFTPGSIGKTVSTVTTPIATYTINGKTDQTFTISTTNVGNKIEVEFAPVFGYKFTNGTSNSSLSDFINKMGSITSGIIGGHGNYNVSFDFDSAEISTEQGHKGNLIVKYIPANYFIIEATPKITLRAAPTVDSLDNIFGGVANLVITPDGDNYSIKATAKDRFNFAEPISNFANAISWNGYETAVTGNKGEITITLTKKTD